MAEWTIQLCESAFSKKKPFGGLYYHLNGVVAGHSFVRLVDPEGQPVEEIHGGALHASHDSREHPHSSQLQVLADMILPEKISRYRLFSWMHQGEDCMPAARVVGASVLISDTESEVKRKWVNGLEFAARINWEDRRYHFLDSNCNTLSQKLTSAMGVGIHSTVTGTFGLNGEMRGSEVDTFGAYFNLHAGETLEMLERRRALLTAHIGAGVRPRSSGAAKGIDYSDLALK